MKIALVGAGTITAHYFAAEALLSDFVIADAYDPDDAALQRLPARVRVHHTLAAMLARSDADLFIIATPSDTHLEILIDLLTAGVTVAVEKPMVVDRADLLALKSAVGERADRVYGMFHFARAAEVLAWKERHEASASALGELRAGSCGFYDPYVTDGVLLPRAKSLIGSWLDSGINALSVLDAICCPTDLRVRSASMTTVPDIPCRQIAGTVFYEARVRSTQAFFAIDTNWTLGINSKVTQLYYEHAVATLDHSAESIAVAWNDGRSETYHAGSAAHRMATHYAGVFTELRRRSVSKEGNFEAALALHRVLLDAVSVPTGVERREASGAYDGA